MLILMLLKKKAYFLFDSTDNKANIQLVSCFNSWLIYWPTVLALFKLYNNINH